MGGVNSSPENYELTKQFDIYNIHFILIQQNRTHCTFTKRKGLLTLGKNNVNILYTISLSSL